MAGAMSDTMEEYEAPPEQQYQHYTEQQSGSHLYQQQQQQQQQQAIGLPTDAELTLLCLDYLRDLRRAYSPKMLETIEGIDADYITIACWALNRAFVSPDYLSAQSGNDAFFDLNKNASSLDREIRYHPARSGIFPSVSEMEKEILHREHPTEEKRDNVDSDDDQNDPYNLYEYDDNHLSNSHRFYPLAGLASGPTFKGPLTLGEITAAGLAGLGARSRLEAERDMIQSPLFEQFLNAVESKGFFEEKSDIDAEDTEEAEQRRQQLYEERYRKVVAKFRTKLASKADGELTGDLLAMSAADRQRGRRLMLIEQAMRHGEIWNDPGGETASQFGESVTEGSVAASSAPPPSYVQRTCFASKLFSANVDPSLERFGGGGAESVVSSHNPVDLEEAERLKNEGNSYMQKKEYANAAECYTQALILSPDGPNSHVYFSNRAAALVSMKKFEEAIYDSERSLALRPDYGKAHSRLGLAHFLLGNYRQAMEAYTVALKYEPDNKSNKNYLEKAAKKLAEMGEKADSSQASFSIVSEWERSLGHKTLDYTTEERQKSAEEREAEKFKVKGNSLMANRDYGQAMEAYTRAIELAPNGSQAHVYYSNRAAALCYLERYRDAERDSLISLSLNPTYGKAHARLGLSRYFLQDYAGAVQAYSAALKYDPDNAASKSYLAKAKAKLHAELESKRLLEDPDLRAMAIKAMSSPDRSSLLNDPEMKSLADSAMKDPSIMAAFGGH